jgi:hypothetical protein
VAVIANAGAIGVLAFSRLPVHPANTKANNRAMIFIRAIPILSGFQKGDAANGMLLSELAAGNMIRRFPYYNENSAREKMDNR